MNCPKLEFVMNDTGHNMTNSKSHNFNNRELLDYVRLRASKTNGGSEHNLKLLQYQAHEKFHKEIQNELLEHLINIPDFDSDKSIYRKLSGALGVVNDDKSEVTADSATVAPTFINSMSSTLLSFGAQAKVAVKPHTEGVEQSATFEPTIEQAHVFGCR